MKPDRKLLSKTPLYVKLPDDFFPSFQIKKERKNVHKSSA